MLKVCRQQSGQSRCPRESNSCVSVASAGEPMTTSDDALINRAIGGDEAALTALLRSKGPQIRAALAGRIAPCFQSVLSEDDVMQVTYLEAFLGIGRAKPTSPESFCAWLAKIAENNLLNAIRALEAQKRFDPRKQIQPRPGGDSLGMLLDLLAGPGSTPSKGAARREASGLLETAIEQLGEAHRQVVRMYDLEGRSAAEVAAVMHRSEGAMFMLRARAHERLREILGASSDFFGKSS
jgi:RNA polymerase sigma-70 factor, ECF subfamily